MTTFSDIAGRLAQQAIDLPSWAFGNSGTRFKVFSTAWTPTTSRVATVISSRILFRSCLWSASSGTSMAVAPDAAARCR